MQQLHTYRSTYADQKTGRGILRTFIILFLWCFVLPAFAQSQPNKIQEGINSIKETYADESRDYITDGQRIVWVKSYKKWTPSDFPTIKKEAPHVLRFLYKAIEHQRLDVLEQLLPNYYRLHGGIKAFVEDIKKTQ